MKWIYSIELTHLTEEAVEDKRTSFKSSNGFAPPSGEDIYNDYLNKMMNKPSKLISKKILVELDNPFAVGLVNEAFKCTGKPFSEEEANTLEVNMLSIVNMGKVLE